jgi:anti-sigma factor RsiW
MTDARRPGGLTCDEVRDLAPSFVLGALDEAEIRAVREHVASCPEAHDEMAELGGVVPALDAAVPLMEPPSALKDRIMAAAAADLDARRQEPLAAPPAQPPPRASLPAPGPVSIESARRRPWTWVAGIAAILALAVLGGWNLSLQGQLDAARAYQRNVASVLDAASQPGALTAVMSAPSGQGPNGLAAVTRDGRMRVAMRDLSPTSGEEVYEAWMILPEGAPAPVGGFTVGADGSGYLETGGLPTQPGVVLALTREPRSGMTAPSGDPVSVGTTTATSTSSG